MITNYIQSILLWIINSIESTLSIFARIDNINFYSKEFIETYKGNTVEEFLTENKKMDDCMSSGKNCLMQDGIVYKDIHLEDHFE